jgi:hypothetical protein
MKICADNKKIIGNFVVSFATTYLAVQAVGLGTDAFYIALINAVVMGMLSAGKEMLAQSGGDGTKLHKALSKAVLI